ncbi:MAG: phenylalanine--tRNA ligase subunit alpha [Candidatus Pacebacteria bacterium]|nr:phenylalanine--tRNA ligase subunit alpha [Candidatus Paceibacterota bacterium]
MDLKEIGKRAENEIRTAQNQNDLKKIVQKYLGKTGEITQILHSLKNLSNDEKKQLGQDVNILKTELMNLISSKEIILAKKELEEIENKTDIDLTMPARQASVGHLHPITQVEDRIIEIFSNLGFEVAQGPEAETEWYNFDALNIPKDHPARDLWDTFWLKTEKKMLLRTHTSPVQVRYMEKHVPPIKIIAPGRIFRYEATDSSHEINFYQLEGLMIDRDITLSDLKGIIEKFFQAFFGGETEIRLRPSFFPFTEPSVEVDIKCLLCKGKGCSACSQRGWLEMGGAGMVHPEVLKSVGLNPKQWQGFAFGMGLDRLTMMKYKVDNIRLFYSGDLRFLEQF